MSFLQAPSTGSNAAHDIFGASQEESLAETVLPATSQLPHLCSKRVIKGAAVVAARPCPTEPGCLFTTTTTITTAAVLVQHQHVGPCSHALLPWPQLHAAAAPCAGLRGGERVLPQQPEGLCVADGGLEFKLDQGQDLKGGEAAQERRATRRAKVDLQTTAAAVSR